MDNKVTKKVNSFLFTPEQNNNLDTEDFNDKHLEKIIEEIYSTDNIEVKTDLNENEIRAITKGQLYAEKYKCNIVDNLCNKLMILKVSNKRMGRKEFKEISQSMQPSYPEEQTMSIPQRLFGKEK